MQTDEKPPGLTAVDTDEIHFSGIFFYHVIMLKEVNIRFYAELNDLLPADRRDTGFNYDIIKPRSVKDLIESQLLPLTKQHYDRFYQCDTCQKIYWEGSQFENTQMLIKQLNGVSNDKL